MSNSTPDKTYDGQTHEISWQTVMQLTILTFAASPGFMLVIETQSQSVIAVSQIAITGMVALTILCYIRHMAVYYGMLNKEFKWVAERLGYDFSKKNQSESRGE